MSGHTAVELRAQVAKLEAQRADAELIEKLRTGVLSNSLTQRAAARIEELLIELRWQTATHAHWSGASHDYVGNGFDDCEVCGHGEVIHLDDV